MAKIAKPGGLNIARTNNTFACSWKRNGSDYNDGQQFQFRVGLNGVWKSWVGKGIKPTTTAVSIPLSMASYYPNNKKPRLTAFAFRVRGNQKKKVKDKNPGWSDWETKVFQIRVPPAPTLTAALSETFTNQTTFSWTQTVPDATYYFTRIQYQTALVENCEETDGSKFTYGGTNTSTATSGSVTYTEDTDRIYNGNSWTRWVRIRAQGPAGDSSPWVYAKHIYAEANPTTNVSATTKESVTGGIECTVKWNIQISTARPLDSMVIQYAITAEPDDGLECPTGISWTDGGTVQYREYDANAKIGSDQFRLLIDDTLGNDECLFVRVNTKHDTIVTPGRPVLAGVGRLKPPTGVSVLPLSDHQATISATNSSEIDDAFLAVVYQGTNDPTKSLVVGIIPPGEEDVTVQCPDWDDEPAKAFGVYAAVGQYAKQTRADGVDAYAITPYPGKPLMISETVWEGGDVPSAPSGLTINATDIVGTIRAAWNWNWESATGIELSWADHDDAWESTDEPETFEIDNLHAVQWNISGLETGVKWYVRARFFREAGDDTVYSQYCDAVSIDLSSAPSIPSLVLSEAVITADGLVTASWAYSTTDNTSQAYAELCEASYSTSGGLVYGDIIARTETAQHVAISAKDVGWESGETHLLCVRVVSASGKISDNWSDPVAIIIADPITCTITDTSLETVTVDADTEEGLTRSVLSLTEVPLTLTVTGAGTGGETTVVIERATDYHVDRPNEDVFTGFAGETIALVSQMGEAEIEIGTDDLIGALDDGAQYRLVASVKDGYGQTASASIDFEVHWSHQALIPSAIIEVDRDNYAIRIIPEAPTGTIASDYADIYRLSADKPELIFTGAQFGETYVDPYPSLGDYCGHRIVFRTANGDFITADNEFAWFDTDEQENGLIDLEAVVIDFGGDRVILPYNIDLSATWSKDFTETTYLGGSVQGDWNPGVSRSASINSVLINLDDKDTIMAMRRLSVYSGICHVRTPDGSSYAADVQVNEERSHSSGGRVVTYKLTVTRVDPEELDGVTLADWTN